MQKQSGCEDFIHPVLNEEVRTISGCYMLSQEKLRRLIKEKEPVQQVNFGGQ
jgi:hypothetical protein